MLASFVTIEHDVGYEVEGYIRVAISPVRQDGQDIYEERFVKGKRPKHTPVR